ncbi:MAG: TnsA endonuclease N-terminal domain-containing protein [Oscillospiraceae bacterium]|nr:TnsA endonuclease N-terminal domain-containing protein [Oscillospiraceae bacterium]
MAKRKRIWNQGKYESHIKSGRGLGEGQSYVPWITVQDFSSKGISSRVFSYKTNRVHHFLSRNELSFFYLLEWSDNVLDIREQFPLLDMELAVALAKDAEIRYPRDSISGFPYILTCDFMITTKRGSRARTIKSVSELNKKRTLEKLEIERRYWEYLGIDWRIVTEHEIDFRKSKNIEWFYTAAILPDHLSDWRYREAVLERIRTMSIHQVSKWFDECYGFPEGSGLRLIKHLMWHKAIACEMIKGNEYSQAVSFTYDLGK